MNKKTRQSGTFSRLLSYIIRNSGWMFAVVCGAVVVSTGAGVLGSMFTQVVIDDYITLFYSWISRTTPACSAPFLPWEQSTWWAWSVPSCITGSW